MMLIFDYFIITF